MERRQPPTEGVDMAKSAVAPLESPASARSPYVRLPTESESGSDARNFLTDISVDDTERDALLDSRCKARIQIETHLRPHAVLASFLEFISRHAAGRGIAVSLLGDGALLMTFNIPDASQGSTRLVHDFAYDVARILDRSEEDISEVAVIEMNDDRVHRELAALGIRQPDLKPV